jgi:hypothetical protein
VSEPIGIGSTVWVFDINHRVYTKPHSHPDYRQYWVERKVTGETSRSWCIGYRKCPKKGPHNGYSFTEQEVDDDVWSVAERHKIIRVVERCDIATLRSVAAVLSYTAGSGDSV